MSSGKEVDDFRTQIAENNLIQHWKPIFFYCERERERERERDHFHGHWKSFFYCKTHFHLHGSREGERGGDGDGGGAVSTGNPSPMSQAMSHGAPHGRRGRIGRKPRLRAPPYAGMQAGFLVQMIDRKSALENGCHNLVN